MCIGCCVVCMRERERELMVILFPRPLGDGKTDVSLDCDRSLYSWTDGPPRPLIVLKDYYYYYIYPGHTIAISNLVINMHNFNVTHVYPMW